MFPSQEIRRYLEMFYALKYRKPAEYGGCKEEAYVFRFLVSPFTGNVAKGAMIMAVSILVVSFFIWDVWFKFCFPFFLSFGSARGLSF